MLLKKHDFLFKKILKKKKLFTKSTLKKKTFNWSVQFHLNMYKTKFFKRDEQYSNKEQDLSV